MWKLVDFSQSDGIVPDVAVEINLAQLSTTIPEVWTTFVEEKVPIHILSWIVQAFGVLRDKFDDVHLQIPQVAQQIQEAVDHPLQPQCSYVLDCVGNNLAA